MFEGDSPNYTKEITKWLREIDKIVTDRISIGDYVLTGGELPALVVMDTITRLVPGVLGNEVSSVTESFDDDLLEYPQYSRPEEWEGMKVPPVLLSGDHQKVDEWRLEESFFASSIELAFLYTCSKTSIFLVYQTTEESKSASVKPYLSSICE